MIWRLIPLKDWEEHKWHWIVSLIAPFILVIGGHSIWRIVLAPWRVHQDQEKSNSEKIEKLSCELEKAKADYLIVDSKLKEVVHRAQGPKLYLHWETPKDFEKLGVRKQRFIVQNSSDIDAYHVKIQDICIDKHRITRATFEEINRLTKNTSLTAELQVLGNIGTGSVNDFSMIYAATDEIPPEYKFLSEHGGHILKFPIFVSYQEYDGKISFKSEFEFTFDLTTMSLHDRVRFIKCEKTLS